MVEIHKWEEFYIFKMVMCFELIVVYELVSMKGRNNKNQI